VWVSQRNRSWLVSTQNVHSHWTGYLNDTGWCRRLEHVLAWLPAAASSRDGGAAGGTLFTVLGGRILRCISAVKSGPVISGGSRMMTVSRRFRAWLAYRILWRGVDKFRALLHIIAVRSQP
jgi:hypothetical protein